MLLPVTSHKSQGRFQGTSGKGSLQRVRGAPPTFPSPIQECRRTEVESRLEGKSPAREKGCAGSCPSRVPGAGLVTQAIAPIAGLGFPMCMIRQSDSTKLGSPEIDLGFFNI